MPPGGQTPGAWLSSASLPGNTRSARRRVPHPPPASGGLLPGEGAYNREIRSGILYVW